MTLTLQPVRVETGGEDEDGCLVFSHGKLIAVLVRLSGEHDEEELAGRWFLEAGLGPLDGPSHPTFLDIEAAQAWIAERIASRRTHR